MSSTRFSGYVQRITFESNGFYILNMYIDQKEKSYTVRGDIHGLQIQVGSWFAFEGDWDQHPKYGWQLKITRAPIFNEDSPEDICKLLTSHGVDESLVETIVNSFSDEFPACLSDLEKLLTILSEKNAKEVFDRWKILHSVFRSLDILSGLGLSVEQINNIWKTFPQGVYDILTHNPWLLVKVDGMSFDLCDQLSEELNLPKTSLLRIEGAALASLKETRSLGSVFVGTGPIASHMKKLLSDLKLTGKQIGECLKSLHEKKEIVIDSQFGASAIYDPWMFKMEKESSEALKDRLQRAVLEKETLQVLKRSLPSPEKDLRERLKEYIGTKRFSEFSLTEDQIQAVIHGVLEPVSILTGGPGSGKTTTLKVLIGVLKDFGIKFSVVAPTGAAAKRAQEVTGNIASTIHREFGSTGFSVRDEENISYEGIVSITYKDSSSEDLDSFWGCNPQSPHFADLVIIDEASMKDLHMLYRILQGTKPSCRIYIVGDVDQLPSVGAGRVLSDLICSGKFKMTRLNEIFRQKETSQIAFVAKDIREGKFPESSQMGKDFFFIERRKEEEVLKTVLEISQTLYKKRVNFQVMSPRHGGTLGVTNLNSNLRQLINPSGKNKKEVKIGGDYVREEDRIMIFQNEYSLNLHNGDLGKISFISKDRKSIEIKLHENPPRNVNLSLQEAKRLLRLAYATTINKMQGQELDVVVIPWVKSFGRQLKRKLLYTAVTRAKKRVLLVGHLEAFERAILNGKEDVRNSYLRERILKYENRGSSVSD